MTTDKELDALVRELTYAAGGGSWPRTLPKQAASAISALRKERDRPREVVDAVLYALESGCFSPCQIPSQERR